MLTIPPDAEITELPTATIWRDENGILYAILKKTPPPTMEQTIEAINGYKKVTGGEKHCIMIDVTHSPQSSREVREYAAKELPKLFKAMALLSKSALGKMLANLFFNLKSQPYPVKMFNTEKEARAWLEKFI